MFPWPYFDFVLTDLDFSGGEFITSASVILSAFTSPVLLSWTADSISWSTPEGEFFGPGEFLRIAYTTSASTVPEPGSLVLLGSGLAGLGAWRRRKRSS